MKLTLSLILLASSLSAQDPPSQPKPAREPGFYALLKTSQGDIAVKLFELEAPLTVQNFVDLARGTKAWRDPKTREMVRRPLYSNTIFHRVIPKFMIQGGDPTGTGMGEIGFTIKDEFAPTLKFDQPGRLGMANIGKPNTGSSQFFITEVATPHLDGQHTIFGQVVEGQEVVNKIAHAPAVNEKPKPAIVLLGIIFQREGPVPPGGVVMRSVVPARKVPPSKKSLPGAKK
jgi:cyclophilin family peptidyl-prolyl cis-trans isomerase